MKRITLFIAIIVMLLASCVLQDLKSPADMSAKELATWAMGIYNAQYDNYKALVVRTDLTEDYKEMLRQKKAILVELWPLLKLYIGYVDTGAIPTQELEAKIIGLIDDLILAGD